MKAFLAIKTLFRTPGKTLFTFILIAVLTFSLFIQLSEYVKTAAEFEATVDGYTGTGYVEYRPPTYTGRALSLPYYLQTDPRVDAVDIPEWEQYQYPPLSAETVDEISNMPHISAVYKRYMTAGVSEQYKRMREYQSRYDYNGRIILEGTLDLKSGVPSNDTPWSVAIEGLPYSFRDVKILAGDAQMDQLLWPDGAVRVGVMRPVYFPNGAPGISEWEINSRVKEDYWRVKTVYLNNYIYGASRNFVDGNRYVLVCRFERNAANQVIGSYPLNVTRESLTLYDWVSEHCCPALWNVTDVPENYLDLPEYAPLKKLIEVTETDLNTFDVVYASDMSAIRRIDNNSLRLLQGRWLTPLDTAEDVKVCVIHQSLAKEYDLHLGDSMALMLGHTTFEQFYSLGAIASVPERFAETWTEAEFEIVGIYTGGTLLQDANEPNWAYSANTVFVPLASLPLTEDELAGHAFYPGEITIRVEDAWDIGPFIKKTLPKLEALGLTVRFDDGGWMPVLEGYRDAQRIPLIRILLLAFVTVVGVALSVYLFVSRKRKDYAIMRALGTPKDKSAKALLAPITVLSLAAVLFGVAAGMVCSRALLGMVSPIPMAICLVGEPAFTLLFAGLSIHRLSKLSPLALLQGSVSRAKKARHATGEKKKPEAVQGTLYVPNSIKIRYEPLPVTRRPASQGFRLRYVWRHIRRQGVKSALAVLLAALMVGAVTQLASLRATYNGLREATVTSVQFVRSLSLYNLQKLEEVGLAKDVYYERTVMTQCTANGYVAPINIVITPKPERFLNEEYEVSFGEGYSTGDIGRYNHALLGGELMSQYGVQPGDILRIDTGYITEKTFREYRQRLANEMEKALGRNLMQSEYPSTREAYARYHTEIDRILDQMTVKVEVIGSIRMNSGRYKNAMFIAGIDDAVSPVGTYQAMPMIEFTLSDNTRLEEMRQKGLELTGGREGAFTMDSAALESVIRTSNLLNGLFPAAVALALLIGAAMCALLVMQTTKDAAIMRAQGTTKRTTRSILAVEQILLGVLGVILGLGVMLAWKRGAFGAIAVQVWLFAGGYVLAVIFASFTSAAFATRKNILELLQAKE